MFCETDLLSWGVGGVARLPRLVMKYRRSGRRKRESPLTRLKGVSRQLRPEQAFRQVNRCTLLLLLLLLLLQLLFKITI